MSVSPSTARVGFAFVFQLTGFKPGTVNVTVTYPNGTSKGFTSSANAGGSGTFTFTTKKTDPVGRYSIRFVGGGLSVTTTIQATP